MQNNTFLTLFVGQNLIILQEIDSTNDFLKKLLSKSEPLPEGTVIMADKQFAGRGQQQNKWQSEPGKNLTMSLLLKPVFLPVNQQFYLNMVVSLGVCDALRVFLPSGLKIKWPNDIYHNNQKLGGILIENLLAGNIIKSAVVGIGLNINQQEFEGDLKEKAVSVIQILQQDVNLKDILAEICRQTEKYYLRLKEGHYSFLRENYLEKLYKKDIPALYRYNGEVFEGRITGITETGLLKVLRHEVEETYGFKEIEFINK